MTLAAIISLVFGLIIGSFLNVCIYRIPRELSIVSPASSCPNCKTPIRAWDNIPVISYLILAVSAANAEKKYRSVIPQ